MQCPKCSSLENVKAGFTKQKQRYKCKACGCFYTRPDKKGYSKELKRLAIQLYLEGLGFRAIARVLKVSDVAVLKWVRQLGESLEELKATYPAKVDRIEIDEIHHYVGKKTTSDGFGLLVMLPEENSSISRLVVVTQ